MNHVVIVGCGDLGGQHAEAWSIRPDAKVVAVCDPDRGRATALGDRYGAAVYTDWEEAITHDAATAVSVCTPACFHARITIASLSLKRHVLCEKAMALTLADADAMIQAADQHGVKLVISHQLRGAGPFVVIKQLIDDGVLGEPLFIRFTDIREVRPKLAMHRLSMNGGPIHDMSGHFFDLARWFTGSEAEQVFARGQVFGRGKPRLDSIDDADFGIDAAEIIAGFEGGHTLSMNINWGMPEEMPGFGGQEVVCGPHAMARIDAANDRVVVHDAKGERSIAFPESPAGPAVRIQDLVHAIQNNHRPEVDGRAGRKVLQLTLGALQSIQTGRVSELV